MAASPLHLACELQPEHGGGVQAVEALSDTCIVTGGDDRLVTVWTRSSESAPFSPLHQCHEHGDSLRVIRRIPPCAAFPTGGFATGCLDGSVRLFSVDAAGSTVSLLRTLTGHSKGVISLSWTSTGELISGGWDGHARVWDIATGSCLQVLEGHENGTCVLGLPNGDIVVGSTGRKNDANQHVDFKIRMWRASHPGGPRSVARVLTDHEQAVRDLALLAGGVGFVSVGNDGAVKLRDLSGDTSSTLLNPLGPEGKHFSAFRVSVAPNGDILTCNEDSVVRVYAWASIASGGGGGGAAEEVVHPGQPWAVSALPNGDVVTGCNQAGTSKRGHVYVWTRAASRFCDESAMAKLGADMEPPPKPSGGDGSGSGLPDGVSLSGDYDSRRDVQGSKDGGYGFFRCSDGSIMACMWSTASGQWTDLGTIQGPPEIEMGNGGSSGGGGGGGSAYDYNLAVTMETPQGVRSLRLQFNEEDDPNSVAHAFINKHALSVDNFEEVRNFILTNRTGRVATRRAEASSLPKFSSFPPSGLTTLDAVPDTRKLLAKLRELNGGGSVAGSPNPAVAALALTPPEFDALAALVTTLAETSRWHASEVSRGTVALLCRKPLSWPPAAVFPALDLLRVLVCHPDGAEAIAQVEGAAFIRRETARVSSLAVSGDPSPEAIAAARVPLLLCARVLLNALKEAPTRRLVLADAPAVLDAVSDLIQFPHASVLGAAALLLQNFAYVLCEQHKEAAGAAAARAFASAAAAGAGSAASAAAAGAGAAAGAAAAAPDSSVVHQVLGLLVEGFRVAKEEDAALRLLCTLGTLVLMGYGPAAKGMELFDTLSTLPSAFPGSEAVRKAVMEVQAANARVGGSAGGPTVPLATRT